MSRINIGEGDTKKRSKGFKFIVYCNNYTTNDTDQRIARVILKHIDDVESITLEGVAEETFISTASVSRFVKKAGFSSFRDFKDSMIELKRSIHFNRTVGHMQRFTRSSPEQIVTSLYDDAINNLHQTRLKMDYDKLNMICQRLILSKTVYFVGDIHELDIFYTTQLDLIANDIPCYLFKRPLELRNQLPFLDEDTTIVILSIYNDFSLPFKDIIDKIIETKATTIAFSQEKFFSDVDINYEYGIENSKNDGYYSLEFINKVINELIYKQ